MVPSWHQLRENGRTILVFQATLSLMPLRRWIVRFISQAVHSPLSGSKNVWLVRLDLHFALYVQIFMTTLRHSTEITFSTGFIVELWPRNTSSLSIKRAGLGWSTVSEQLLCCSQWYLCCCTCCQYDTCLTQLLWTAGEFDSQGSSGEEGSPVCARQPRTLSMAIVPGEHIRTIMLAKQINTTEMSSEEKIEHSSQSDSDARNLAECASTRWHP